MFYHIEGFVSEIGQNLVVIDCNGLGFGLNVTAHTLSQVKLNEKVKLFVAESIGETNYDLYGFAAKGEKRCFEMLISVSGIGPKAALSILSYNTPEALAMAVLNEDLKALTVAPGIGKKIAQRVILELKDKLRKEMNMPDMGGFPIAAAPQAADSHVSDALAALTVLGYSSAEIGPVLRNMDVSGMNAEQIIKAVLKQMVK